MDNKDNQINETTSEEDLDLEYLKWKYLRKETDLSVLINHANNISKIE